MNFGLNSTDLNDINVPSRFGSALGATAAFFFIFFGIIGDSLIIAAILSKKELRTNLINIFIVSLQLNDIFNIGFNQFLVGLSYVFMKWHGPYLLCEIFVYTSIISTGSLLWHHALISIYRYLVVVCNFNVNHYGISPKVYIILSIVVARLIPVLVCMPAFKSRHMTEYSSIALRCMLAPNVSAFQNLLIVLINMLIPCLIVIVCFVYIFAKVRNVSKNVRNPHKSKNKSISASHCSSSLRREIRITKMFAIIFTVFLFGYLPYGIIRLIDKDNDFHPDFYVFLTVLFIISISISPIVYGLMNNQIRSQCIVILNKLFTCTKVESGHKHFTLVLDKSATKKKLSFKREHFKVAANQEFSRVENVAKSNIDLTLPKLFAESTADFSTRETGKKLSLSDQQVNLISAKKRSSFQKSSDSIALKQEVLNDDGGVYIGPT
ncbi:trapped in endoderm-1-like [Brachionus plicatilis]|uniref:Trapped in endoderm-1-like n=1 Tax=Brachionus plicatilis TaxID=10195 RepID=A0A3M7RUZ0_BRAPC|nr:trapped in endoderm-1-like [Brachionus plicatilis]